jgi:hypothetical protein
MKFFLRALELADSSDSSDSSDTDMMVASYESSGDDDDRRPETATSARTKQTVRKVGPRAQHYIDMCRQLIANKDKLQDRTVNGKSGKQKQSSYGIETVNEYYPRKKGKCESLGKCMIDAVEPEIIKTTYEFSQVAPLIRELSPYMYKNPSDTYMETSRLNFLRRSRTPARTGARQRLNCCHSTLKRPMQKTPRHRSHRS